MVNKLALKNCHFFFYKQTLVLFCPSFLAFCTQTIFPSSKVTVALTLIG